VAESNRWGSFLIGLISGAVIGSVVTFWLVDRTRWSGRRRGAEPGGRAGEIASIVMERGSEFLERVKEVIREAIEEGREAARQTRSELEERFGGESEEQ